MTWKRPTWCLHSFVGMYPGNRGPASETVSGYLEITVVDVWPSFLDCFPVPLLLSIAAGLSQRFSKPNWNPKDRQEFARGDREECSSQKKQHMVLSVWQKVGFPGKEGSLVWLSCGWRALITIRYFRWCQLPSFFIEASRTCFFLILFGIYSFYHLFILTLVSLEVSSSFNICSILSLSRSPGWELVLHSPQRLLHQRWSLGGGDAPAENLFFFLAH